MFKFLIYFFHQPIRNFIRRIRKRFFCWLYLVLFLLPNSLSLEATTTSSHPKKVVRILSIDGGGVRGIIPAILLEHLESLLLPGLRLADCFDIISGTSTGGLIALMLTKPDAGERPQYKAADIVTLYETLSRQVFFSQSLWQWLKSGNGLWDAKYSAKTLEASLDQYLGQTRLKECLAKVIIPAYEIELDKTFFFKSTRAQQEPSQDCAIKDLARATSAAPTYFRPATLVDGTHRTLSFVDGGLGANNPTLAATVYAVEVFSNDIDFFIVSLGTGTNYGSPTKNIEKEEVQTSGLLGWASKIISLMMYAVNDITDYEMGYVFNHGQTKQYFRFQPILSASQIQMDNVDEDNIESLKQEAYKLIQNNQPQLEEIAKTLNTPKD